MFSILQIKQLTTTNMIFLYKLFNFHYAYYDSVATYCSSNSYPCTSISHV
jgi:hypothetical protein